MLDLDEMKQHWAEQDRKLEQSLRLNRQLLGAANLGAARSALDRLTAKLGVEVAVWSVIVIALGGFIYRHAATLRLLLAGGAADLFAIAMLAATIRQIVAARQIDYSKPVAAIQQQLEAFRILRIRVTQWGVLAGLAVWAPFAIVVCKAFLGFDLDNAVWLWANVLFGLALIPLALWLAKRFAAQMDRSPFIQRLMRDIAGQNLAEAQASLASLAQFEEERQPG